MPHAHSLRSIVLAALVGLAAEGAHASSIDIVWQDPGGLSLGATATADVVLTIGVGDSPWGGAGAVIDVDLAYVGVTYLSRGENISALDGIIHGLPVDDGLGHVENFIAGGDLLGFAGPLLPGSVTVIGTVTVLLDTVPVSLAVEVDPPGDDIIGSGPQGSILSEFSLGSATFVPEPGTASLLALGLAGLAAARRRRVGGWTPRSIAATKRAQPHDPGSR